MKQFKRRAHQYLSSATIPQSEMEWLALMQHHGAPTRLLDFTESPWVAAFFALEDAELSENCAVWAIDRQWISRIVQQTLLALNLTDASVASNFNTLFMSNRFKFVADIGPERFNERLTYQQGIFLCMGSVNTTFMDNLFAANDGGMDSGIWRIIIPGGCRREALFELDAMNINRATLFPGIDGFAQSLRNLYLLQIHKERALTKSRAMPDRIKELRRITEERLKEQSAQPEATDP